MFIILLENVQKFLQNHFWFAAGLDYDISRNYVGMSKLSKESDYAKLFPGIYAHTVINYLPAFYKKGKVRLLMTKKNIFGCKPFL